MSSSGGLGDQAAMLSPPRSISSVWMRGSTALAASSAAWTALAVVMPLRGLHETPRIFSVLPPPASAARAEVEVAAKAATPAVARKFRRVRLLFIRCSFGLLVVSGQWSPRNHLPRSGPRCCRVCSRRGVDQPDAAQDHQHAADVFDDRDALGLLVPVQEALHHFRERARQHDHRAVAHTVGQQQRRTVERRWSRPA